MLKKKFYLPPPSIISRHKQKPAAAFFGGSTAVCVCDLSQSSASSINTTRTNELLTSHSRFSIVISITSKKLYKKYSSSTYHTHTPNRLTAHNINYSSFHTPQDKQQQHNIQCPPPPSPPSSIWYLFFRGLNLDLTYLLHPSLSHFNSFHSGFKRKKRSEQCWVSPTYRRAQTWLRYTQPGCKPLLPSHYHTKPPTATIQQDMIKHQIHTHARASSRIIPSFSQPSLILWHDRTGKTVVVGISQ